jgi:hypothetical protein
METLILLLIVNILGVIALKLNCEINSRRSCNQLMELQLKLKNVNNIEDLTKIVDELAVFTQDKRTFLKVSQFNLLYSITSFIYTKLTDIKNKYEPVDVEYMNKTLNTQQIRLVVA